MTSPTTQEVVAESVDEDDDSAAGRRQHPPRPDVGHTESRHDRWKDIAQAARGIGRCRSQRGSRQVRPHSPSDAERAWAKEIACWSAGSPSAVAETRSAMSSLEIVPS